MMRFRLMAVMATDEQIAGYKAYTDGTEAFYDAFTHILPCVVVKVLEEGNGAVVLSGKLLIRLTEDRGPYRRGEEMEVTGYHTYPVKCQYLRGRHYRIDHRYRWVIKPERPAKSKTSFCTSEADSFEE